jgi:cytochrome d ubiquinol oxidase subunit II
MHEIWYAIVVFMLTAYVVLDGFDFGAGALHWFVARNDVERREVLAAIGPFWDGNEVWLLAAGGALLVGFPRVLASGVSGFYFAIFLVLWSLILRGISMEFGATCATPSGASPGFFFSCASVLLPVFFGAALGNLLRGLPLTAEGWFELDLSPISRRGRRSGSRLVHVLVGVFALAALAAHGGTFLVWKTSGAVQARSRAAAMRLYGAVAVLWPIVTLATMRVNAGFLPALFARPLSWLLALVALAGLVAVFRGLRGGRDLTAFLGSCAFLAGLSVATAVGVFPVMLRAIGDPALSLTADNAGGDPAGLKTALAGSWSACRSRSSTSVWCTVFTAARPSPLPTARGIEEGSRLGIGRFGRVDVGVPVPVAVGGNQDRRVFGPRHAPFPHSVSEIEQLSHVRGIEVRRARNPERRGNVREVVVHTVALRDRVDAVQVADALVLDEAADGRSAIGRVSSVHFRPLRVEARVADDVEGALADDAVLVGKGRPGACRPDDETCVAVPPSTCISS